MLHHYMPLNIDYSICTFMDSDHNQHGPHLNKLILSDVYMVTMSLHVCSTCSKALCMRHPTTYQQRRAPLV
jgi:hypothetical protein